ncbi:MAG: DUF2254 domain-containing protein [Syntrophobacteraceae bacterium]|nr:DUF2254 domain-containing protein [Syntrophobacteraceae bacterium]
MRSTFSRSIFPWMIPLVYVAATIMLAFTLPPLEYKFLPGLNHEMTTSSAIAIFSSIASGMIALTGIVFSIAFVMVQFSSSAYSPRLVSWFSESPAIFHSLGLFSATFLYALAAIGWVDRNGSGKVPFLSTWVVLLLLISSVFSLVVLIRGVSELQVTRVLQLIGRRGRAAIRNTYSLSVSENGVDLSTGAQHMPISQTLYFYGEPLVIAAIDTRSLVRLAKEAQGLIVLPYAVGDAVMEGAQLLQILGGAKRLPDSALAKTIKLARERAFDQDPEYPMRLLVDIAIKALSPAINDPTTAVQAIDQIEDLLRCLAASRLDVGRMRDEEGMVRLIFPTPKWEDYLSLAIEEISFYGASSFQVMRRLRATLKDLAQWAKSPKKEAVQSYLQHLDDIVSRTFSEERDRNKARQEDRQGLGHTKVDSPDGPV